MHLVKLLRCRKRRRCLSRGKKIIGIHFFIFSNQGVSGRQWGASGRVFWGLYLCGRIGRRQKITARAADRRRGHSQQNCDPHASMKRSSRQHSGLTSFLSAGTAACVAEIGSLPFDTSTSLCKSDLPCYFSHPKCRMQNACLFILHVPCFSSLPPPPPPHVIFAR
jgi:hypothetical protein